MISLRHTHADWASNGRTDFWVQTIFARIREITFSHETTLERLTRGRTDHFSNILADRESAGC